MTEEDRASTKIESINKFFQPISFQHVIRSV